jgi:hypothetical protein
MADMGALRPRHFQLTPTDSDGNRTFQPEIHVSGYGDLSYVFTAEVVTCAEAYRQMAAKKFKGIYRLESKEEQEQRNKYYNGSEEIEAPCGRGPDEETFWITPADMDGNGTFKPKVVSASDGNGISYHFTARLCMGEKAYRRMALDKFKKLYWMESTEEQDQRDQDEHERRQEEYNKQD